MGKTGAKAHAKASFFSIKQTNINVNQLALDFL
jgi:hypothetical protein